MHHYRILLLLCIEIVIFIIIFCIAIAPLDLIISGDFILVSFHFLIRFIFCRAVISLFCSSGDSAGHLPECLPNLPESLSPESAVTQIYIHHLAERLGVSNLFQFRDSIRDSLLSR